MSIAQKNQYGFTLLELLMVVAILSVIAGLSIMSYGDTRSDSEDQAVEIKMQQLQQAVIRYFNDQNEYVTTGSDPTTVSPADIAYLIEKPIISSDWDADYRKGWRGPYIKQSLTANSKVILTGLGFDGEGDPSSGTENEVLVKNDPYFQPIDKNYNPYLFFDLDTYNSSLKTARIVSMGADGLYEEPDCDFSIVNVTASNYCSYEKLCEEQGDDRVVCL